jgi:lipid II:glycine glycyltransferase (peptidoglycan interpeptide bridge formation enzyme)
VNKRFQNVSFSFIHGREAWNQTLLSLPCAHVLQSWDWGDFKSRWGWTVQRLVWQEAGTPIAAAQVLRRPIPRTPWGFLYVTRGPALNYADAPLVELVLSDLETYSRAVNALFIKIDPDVPRQSGEPQAGQPPEATGQALLGLLARRDWRFSPEQIQFRNTVLVNLEPEPDELLAGMKSKWRYNIRLAERRGVTVRPGTAPDIPLFYRMYEETAARDRFLLRPQAYYYDVWSRFLETDQAEMLLACVEDRAVAGLMLFIFGQKAWYMYGASTDQYRQLMPNHLLQWAAISRARARGCTCYDMWGAPDVFDQTDRMWGVYNFKSGFGGQVVQGVGAFDYPVKKNRYRLFTAVLPRVRSMLGRLGP